MIQINENHWASCDACGVRPDAMAVHLSKGDQDFTLCTQCGVDLASILTKFVALSKDVRTDDQQLILMSRPKKSKAKRKR